MTGEELKRKRKAAKIRQHQLGIGMGYPERQAQARISAYECGRRPINSTTEIALRATIEKLKQDGKQGH